MKYDQSLFCFEIINKMSITFEKERRLSMIDCYKFNTMIKLHLCEIEIHCSIHFIFSLHIELHKSISLPLTSYDITQYHTTLKYN